MKLTNPDGNPIDQNFNLIGPWFWEDCTYETLNSVGPAAFRMTWNGLILWWEELGATGGHQVDTVSKCFFRAPYPFGYDEEKR